MEEKPKYSKIVVFGRICTGKSTLVQNLVKALGWDTFSSGQYLRSYARDHHLAIEDAQEQSKKMTNKIDNMIRDVLKGNSHIVIDAWMGGIMSHGIKDVLKILLICDDVERFTRFAQRENISFLQARKRVLHREKKVLEKIQEIHGRHDIFDPKHYNMVIDTSGKKPDEIVSKVLQKLKHT